MQQEFPKQYLVNVIYNVIRWVYKMTLSLSMHCNHNYYHSSSNNNSLLSLSLYLFLFPRLNWIFFPRIIMNANSFIYNNRMGIHCIQKILSFCSHRMWIFVFIKHGKIWILHLHAEDENECWADWTRLSWEPHTHSHWEREIKCATITFPWN